MKIENHFQQARNFLADAEHDFYEKNYSQAVLKLSKAYPHVRSLIELVYKLEHLATSAERSEGDNHP